MGEDVWGEIEAACEAGEQERAISLCLSLDEAGKRSVSARAAKLSRRLRITTKDYRQEGRTHFVDRGRAAQASAADAALYCVGPPSALGRRARVRLDRIEEVVRARPRAWRDDWAEQVVKHQRQRGSWRVLRTLILDGACTKPASIDYARMMVDCVDIERQPGERFRRDPYGGLLADPDLLEDDVWRIFEIEEKILSLGWYDWDTALIRLAEEGAISRERLLDETLGALRRDFPPAVAATFSKFYGLVKPTPLENAARVGQFLDLLGSPVDSTVSFAVRQLSALDRSNGVDARDLIDHLGPAALVRPKGTAKGAIALLGRSLKRQPALAGSGLEIAIDALSHDAAEVQAAAIAVIEKHKASLDGGQRDRLAAAAPHIDPSLRSAAASLLRFDAATGATDKAKVSVAVEVAPAPVLDPMEIRRLHPSRAIRPVDSVDELLELAAIVLERPNDPDEIERLLDGISRLCDQPVPDSRGSALLRQIDRVFKAPFDWDVPTRGQHLIAGLLHQWLRQTAPPVTVTAPRGPRAALGRRLVALGARVERRDPDPLLSAPTHAGGFIDPSVLLERVATARQVDDNDLALAVLRLAPDGRAAALAQANLRDVNGEAIAVVRAALGGEIRRPRLRSRLPASWDSVDVIADPGGVELERVPDDEAYPWQKPPPQIPNSPAVSPARLLGQYESRWRAFVDADYQRWLALISPLHRDIYYGVVVRSLSFVALWFGEASGEQPAAALQSLLDADEPFGEHAYQLLALALGGDDALRLIAGDVVIEAIGTRRLDAQKLGAAIAAAMRRKRAVPDRFGEALLPVPQVSPLHSHEVQRVLEACLAAVGDGPLRMTKVLDLLRKVVVEADAKVETGGARARLEAISPRSKGGQLAQAILAVSGSGAARSHEAAALADAAERQRRLRH